MSEHRRLLKSASTITLFTLLSRIFGYVRDSRIAFLLGAGTASDAFAIAYRIPNLLRHLVGEGAVSASFIPVFSRYFTKKKNQEAWEFANATLTVLTALLAGITVLGIIFSPLVIRLLAPGFADIPGKIELATKLNRVMFPYIFLIGLSAFSMGVLNSFHRFGAPAFAPVLLNLAIIACSFLTGFFSEPSMALAVGVVIGGVLQIAIQIPGLLATGWWPRMIGGFRHPGVRRVGRLMLPVIFGVGIVQINVVVDSQFASHLREGSVTAIYLANRVMELVLGGYAIAISTAVLPMLSRQAAERKMDELKTTLNFATRIILFITIPSAVGLMVLHRPIIEVLFQHGLFDAQSTGMASRSLLFFAIGLPAMSMVKIIVPAFYALHETATPVKVALGALILNIVLNFLLIRPLQTGGPALATSIAAYFNSAWLMVLFRRRYGSFGMGRILETLAKCSAASFVLGAVAYGIVRWPGFYNNAPLAQKILALTVTIVAAVGSYLAVSHLVRSGEVSELRKAARAVGAGSE